MHPPARLLVSAALLALAAGTVGAVGASAQDAPAAPPLRPTPQAACAAGGVPEPGLQGRVPADDVAAGGAAQGYRCNLEVVGTHGTSGGFKVERYVDAAGRECAYYDTTPLFPSNAGNAAGDGLGVYVLDMSDPSQPRQTAALQTPAMLTPHESLLVNAERGLLAAVAGNLLFAPGHLDVYDISADCRAPVLKSSLPVAGLGHESGFSPDGKTFWAASLGGGLLTAVDLTDPSVPRVVYAGNHDTHAITISDDGTRAYLAAGAGFPRNEAGLPGKVDGVEVLDVSQVQERAPQPRVSTVGTLTWDSVTIPQSAVPVTIGGRPYLVEADEFAMTGNRTTGNGERVGAGRIIDISDETRPRVVSDLRLEVHQPEARPSLAGDPDATSATGGYSGHYCAVPRRVDPGIVACSFLASGLRVFDVRDPLRPVEVAYHVAPVPPGGPANQAFASPAFAPERGEVWYSDARRGLIVVRLSEQAWPASVRQAPPAAPSTAPAAAPAAEPTAGPEAGGGTGAGEPATVEAAPVGDPQPALGQLPATGLAAPLLGGLLLLGAALGLARRG